MPRELFLNDTTTTLGATVSTTPAAGTSETWTVASSAAFVFTTAGQYRCRIDNEIVTVTAAPSGTTLTVLRGTEGTIATHANGSTLAQIITAGSLARRFTDGPLNAKDWLKGDGTLEATAAVSAMLTAWNASGRALYWPSGTYLINAGELVVPGDNLTMYGDGRRLGATFPTGSGTMIKQNGNGVLLDASGTTTGTSSRRWYFTMHDLTLHGSDTTGSIFRTYYGSQIRAHRVLFYGKNGYGLDSVELWDSSFIDCEFEWCWSTTVPPLSIRGSQASSGFGSSTDSPNAIRFFNTRVETFKYSAIRVESGVQTGVGAHDVQFFGTKMESGIIGANVPMLLVDGYSVEVLFQGVYMYMGGYDTGYSTPIDLIDWFPGDQGSLRDVWLTNASLSGTSGVWLGVNLGNGTRTVLDNVTGRYAIAPQQAHLYFGFSGINAEIRGCSTNLGNLFAGTVANYNSSPTIQSKKIAIDTGVSEAPTAAAGANAGTSPPAPVVASTSRDQRGSVTFGTGTGSPAAGTYCTITWNSAWAAAPFVTIAPTTALCANLKPYIVSVSTTTLVIGLQTAGATSQANTVYGISWVAIG